LLISYNEDIAGCVEMGRAIHDALVKAGDDPENDKVWKVWGVETEKKTKKGQPAEDVAAPTSSSLPHLKSLAATFGLTRVGSVLKPRKDAAALAPVLSSKTPHAYECPHCDILLPFVPCKAAASDAGSAKPGRVRFSDAKPVHFARQGYAVPYVALEDYTEHEGEQGYLSFPTEAPIFVWNEAGEDIPLEKQAPDGTLWLEGWVGTHAKGYSETDLTDTTEYVDGIFPATSVGAPGSISKGSRPGSRARRVSGLL